jgi:hypothetical protein
MDLYGSVALSCKRGFDNFSSPKIKRIFLFCGKALASSERSLSVEDKHVLSLQNILYYVTGLAFVLQPV